ncbi:MAG TPA: DUF1343 domain-containing protein, partial [Chitinophagales bacterium]|nr:DUF1343 domain-containing protein [Chitinophagales bacterium]
MKRNILILFCSLSIFFGANAKNIITGAERIEQYLPLLKGKQVGLVINQTSVVGSTHLLDTLISLGINIKTVFAPEHGFRGIADAGEHVNNGIDAKTKTPIVSLYGENKKPKPEQLKNIDVLVFDIQDVGVRFYTYISTLQYVMEACAENNKPLLVLDRPNPNGHYIDGPVLENENKSFVGMQAVPVVYGMTIGEYAKMVNGEKLLANKLQCTLTVIPCLNYDHKTFYTLPVKPSPNLPNMAAVYLYPSLCFFEGTDYVSLGRGTSKPFQIYGSPAFDPDLQYSFTPQSTSGAKTPPLLGKLCYGYDLTDITLDSLRKQKFTLKYLLDAYQKTKDKDHFFNSFFIKLAGKASLAVQIEKGMTEADIAALLIA